MFVVKRGMNPPSSLYPLAWWGGGLSLSSALTLCLTHGLSTVLVALVQRGRPWSDPLPQRLCFIDTTATYNTNTMQVTCCWLKYTKFWWHLWRATRSSLQLICSFTGGVNLLKAFFYEVSETSSAGNYLR